MDARKVKTGLSKLIEDLILSDNKWIKKYEIVFWDELVDGVVYFYISYFININELESMEDLNIIGKKTREICKMLNLFGDSYLTDVKFFNYKDYENKFKLKEIFSRL